MRDPNLGGTNGDVQSDLSTLAFNNEEQLEYFQIKIIILKQEIIIFIETLSPTRLLFQYTKALSKIDKIKAFIDPKVTDIITFHDNNGNLDFCTWVNINELYHYI